MCFYLLRPLRPFRRLCCGWALALWVVGMAGCASSSKPRYAGPDAPGIFAPPSVGNVTSVPATPAERPHRVVVLPLCWERYQARSDAHLDQTWLAALQAQQRFEIIGMSREQMRSTFGFTQISHQAALPPDFFAVLAAETGADAVLFTDLTQWSPYPPLEVGVRAYLIDITTGESLWAVDELMSTGHPAVVSAARRTRTNDGAPAPLPDRNFYSPRSFWRLAANEVTATLPPYFAQP